MKLAEVVVAALVWLLGSGAAMQLWSQALRQGVELTQRERRQQSLEGLLLASEGRARQLARSEAAGADCLEATSRLVAALRSQPAGEATLTVPPSAPGTVHLRWEAGELRRERLLSASALGLCREEGDGG